MIVNIKGNEIELKYTFRSMMIYEKIVGESFQPNGITEVIVYLYLQVYMLNKILFLIYMYYIMTHF